MRHNLASTGHARNTAKVMLPGAHGMAVTCIHRCSDIPDITVQNNTLSIPGNQHAIASPHETSMLSFERFPTVALGCQLPKCDTRVLAPDHHGLILLDAQSLRAQWPHNLIDDSILHRFLGVKILVAVEVELDLHGTCKPAPQHACCYQAQDETLQALQEIFLDLARLLWKTLDGSALNSTALTRLYHTGPIQYIKQGCFGARTFSIGFPVAWERT